MTRIFVALFAAALMSAVPLAADSPRVQHDRYADSFSFVDGKTCGFPVEVSGFANIDDAWFYDADGTLVRLNHAVITFSANGVTLDARGSGGVEYTYNADGSVHVDTFGINLLMTLPHDGNVVLDVGHAAFLFDPHKTDLFHAGPESYDDEVYCAALSGA